MDTHVWTYNQQLKLIVRESIMEIVCHAVLINTSLITNVVLMVPTMMAITA
jgi:hypothetical protein